MNGCESLFLVVKEEVYQSLCDKMTEASLGRAGMEFLEVPANALGELL